MSADSFEFFNVRCYCWNLAGSSWYYPCFKPKTLKKILHFNWSPPWHLKTATVTSPSVTAGLPVDGIRESRAAELPWPQGSMWCGSQSSLIDTFRGRSNDWQYTSSNNHGSVKWLYLKGNIGRGQTALCSVALHRSSGAATCVTIKMETSFDRCTWSAAASRMLWPAQHDARPSCTC